MKKIDEIVAVDHIGYAVNSIASAKNDFQALGYSFDEEKYDMFRNVNVCVTEMGGVRVELLAPHDEQSTIDGILKKMGSTPYHICYEVTSMEIAIEKLQDAGYTMMCYPAYSEPLGGDVCFLYSQSSGIVELIDYSEGKSNKNEIRE